MKHARVLRVAAFVLCAGPSASLAADWGRFEVIEWQERTPAAYRGLAQMGVTAAGVIANRATPGADVEGRVAPLEAAGLRYYVENIATDFYAAYHRFVPGIEVNQLYLDTVARWRAHPSDAGAFDRKPSLLDPEWRAKIAERLALTVKAHAPHRPLYYSLGDETGIADLSAQWDFDFSPVSVAGYRDWLAREYGSLAALNREWDSDYLDWSEVVAETTFAAMRREGENFARWSDFRAWMDRSFADAVRFGADAVHRADSSALAGIEGAQKEGWGGYDYGRLAPSLDLMEIYPDPVNIDLSIDLHPGLHVLTTTAAADPASRLEVWRAVLRGSQGLVLWDDEHGLVDDAGVRGGYGDAAAPMLQALHRGIGQRVVGGRPIYDPVVIVYSQPSFRAQWMLDHRANGDQWTSRGADGENDDNVWRAAMRNAAAQLLRLGIRPRWITSEALEHGVPAGTKMLLLPHVLAMSEAGRSAVAAFVGNGGQALADIAPGLFDAHLRKQPRAVETGVAVGGPLWSPVSPSTVESVARTLRNAGIAPNVEVRTDDGSWVADVEVRRLDVGGNEVLTMLHSGLPDKPEMVTVNTPVAVLACDDRGMPTGNATTRLRISMPADHPFIGLTQR